MNDVKGQADVIHYVLVVLVIVSLVGSWMAFNSAGKATIPEDVARKSDVQGLATQSDLDSAANDIISSLQEGDGAVTRSGVVDFLTGENWTTVEGILSDAGVSIPEAPEEGWERQDPEDIEPFEVPEPGVDWLPGPDLAPDTNLPSTTKAGEWKAEPPWTFAWASYGGGNSWSIEHRMVFNHWTNVLKDAGLVEEAIVKIPYFDPDEQLTQLQTLYQQRDEIDALFVTPLNPQLIQGVLSDFYDAGVPVIILNAPYNVETDKFTQAHIYDDRMSGFMMARWLVKELGQDGLQDEQIINIRGPLGTSVDLARQESAMYVFEQYPEIEVVAEEPGNFAYQAGYDAAQSMLSTHPDVDGIFCQSGMSSSGAVDAMLDMDMDLRPISGEDHNGLMKRYLEYRDEGLSTCYVPKQVTVAGKGVLDAAKLLSGNSVKRIKWYEPMYIPVEETEEYVLEDLPDAVWPHSLFGGLTREDLAEQFGE